MVGKQTKMWQLAAVVVSLAVGVACGKGKTPTSPSGSANAAPSATQVGIAAQGIAIDGQYTMNVGDRLQVSAMVTMSDGNREDRTATATWSSEHPQIASAAGGLITALAAGQTVVTARYDQVLARLTVTVRGGSGDGGPGAGGGGGNRSVTHVEIEAAPAVAIGRSTPMALVTHFSDGSREAASGHVTWSVEPSTHASVSDGQLWGIRAGMVTVSARHDGMVDTHIAEVSATELSVTGLDVSGNPAVTVGASTQLVATARLSNGTQQSATTLAQWESSNPGVATVTNGLVRGVSAGSAVITAKVAGVAGQATITVSSAGPAPGPGAVTSLTISGNLSMAVGATSQLTAMAQMADGSQQNVTASAQWSTANGGIATVNAGLVSGLAAGSTTVTVQAQGISRQATVQVTGGGGGGGGTPTLVGVTLQGGTSVVAGQTAQLTATAAFSNGSTQNVTASASWSSTAPAILSVNGGLVSGLTAGAATVNASYQGQTASVQFTVSSGGPTPPPPPPTVVSVAVNGNVSIGIGVSSQLTVLATLSNNTVIDVTALATYQSSNPLLVSVSATGRLTGLLAGLANITASYQGVSASVQVTITVALPVLNSLTINGPSSVRLLQLLTLSAVANMSDGSQQTVTDGCQWSSSNLGILDFVTNGVLRGLLVGNVTVTANYQGQSAQKTVAVTLF